ncbi:hypothetical protein [Alteromonas confluentis]|uniref:Sulfotransferase domain-containing protein n=1 Tax=Alteromonas confluentis TaxID=1656094 RepID=A0A1E7Z9H9_9ALTE|nr:hypothetical protein [Alteromonas confluentis]OFC70111.1 hypothetical protein BFC18_13035 [Alteromonas confluentis]
MKIFIHVGPGKTGSSAIQKWLNDHSDILLQRGFYYPSHGVDENGISSGNALSIFEYNSNSELCFSEDKANAILKKARTKGCHSLILSSEAFIARFEPILNAFSSCEFIYYIRNPLECAESLYNQSVKRHFNTEPISEPKIGYKRLIKLKNAVSKKAGCSINVRLYGKQFFKGGDIVSDFLDAISIKEKFDSESAYVNKSYSFEAVEFKRALNFFPAQKLHAELDRCLQSYEGRIRKFSFINPASYQKAIMDASEALKGISRELDLPLNEMAESLSQATQREFKEQKIKAIQVCEVLIYLHEKNSKLFQTVRFLVENRLLPKHIIDVFDEGFSLCFSQLSAKGKTKGFFRFRNQGIKSLNHQDFAIFYTFADNISTNSGKKEAENFRDLAIYSESKGEIFEALRFIQIAKLKRPHGKIINQKLRELSDKIFMNRRNVFK